MLPEEKARVNPVYMHLLYLATIVLKVLKRNKAY